MYTPSDIQVTPAMEKGSIKVGICMSMAHLLCIILANKR